MHGSENNLLTMLIIPFFGGKNGGSYGFNRYTEWGRGKVVVNVHKKRGENFISDVAVVDKY